MKYTFTRKKNDITVNFDVPAAEWQAALDKSFDDNKGKFNIPGFRKGKAPKSVVLRTYGEGVLYDDAINSLVESGYDQFLNKEKEITPISRPDINIDGLDEKGLKFNLKLIAEPEVTLGEYKGFKLKHSNVKVKDSEVNKEIDRVRERAARKTPVTDRAIANGDVANITYIGKISGNAFEGGSAESQELRLGSGDFIAGFEEQVVGMNIGETKDVVVTFPKDYMATDLAGKEAVFTVTLNGINALEVPAADDNFAKDVSKFDTFAEYKASVKARMEEAANRQSRQNDEDAVLEALAGVATMDIPPVMIDRQIDTYLKDLEYRLAYQGMTLDDYFKYTNSTIEEMRKARFTDAKKAVKLRLAVEAMIKKEKIKITQKEYDKMANDLAAASKMKPEEYAVKNERQLQMMYNRMLMDKAVQHLIDWSEWEGTAATTEKKPAAAKSAKSASAAKKTEVAAEKTAEESK